MSKYLIKNYLNIMSCKRKRIYLDRTGGDPMLNLIETHYYTNELRLTE